MISFLAKIENFRLLLFCLNICRVACTKQTLLQRGTLFNTKLQSPFTQNIFNKVFLEIYTNKKDLEAAGFREIKQNITKTPYFIHRGTRRPNPVILFHLLQLTKKNTSIELINVEMPRLPQETLDRFFSKAETDKNYIMIIKSFQRISFVFHFLFPTCNFGDIHQILDLQPRNNRVLNLTVNKLAKNIDNYHREFNLKANFTNDTLNFICKTFLGSSEIIKILDNCPENEWYWLASNLNIVSLSLDKYGSSVIQKLASKKRIFHLLWKDMSPYIVHLIIDSSQNFTLQKILNYFLNKPLDTDKQSSYMQNLCIENIFASTIPYFETLIYTENGYNIFKTLIQLTSTLNRFFAVNLLPIFRDINANRLICKMIDIHEDPYFITEIVKNLSSLIQDPYGSLILTHVIQKKAIFCSNLLQFMNFEFVSFMNGKKRGKFLELQEKLLMSLKTHENADSRIKNQQDAFFSLLCIHFKFTKDIRFFLKDKNSSDLLFYSLKNNAPECFEFAKGHLHRFTSLLKDQNSSKIVQFIIHILILRVESDASMNLQFSENREILRKVFNSIVFKFHELIFCDYSFESLIALSKHNFHFCCQIVHSFLPYCEKAQNHKILRMFKVKIVKMLDEKIKFTKKSEKIKIELARGLKNDILEASKQ